MNEVQRLALCDNINDMLNESHLNLEDKLSILASMFVGLVNGGLHDPIQRQIHLKTLYDTIEQHCFIKPQ
jgi:hypothetical protein